MLGTSVVFVCLCVLMLSFKYSGWGPKAALSRHLEDVTDSELGGYGGRAFRQREHGGVNKYDLLMSLVR